MFRNIKKRVKRKEKAFAFEFVQMHIINIHYICWVYSYCES